MMPPSLITMQEQTREREKKVYTKYPRHEEIRMEIIADGSRGREKLTQSLPPASSEILPGGSPG